MERAGTVCPLRGRKPLCFGRRSGRRPCRDRPEIDAMRGIDTAAFRNPLPSRRHIAGELSLDTSGVDGQHNVYRASTHRQKVAMSAPCHHHIIDGKGGNVYSGECLPDRNNLFSIFLMVINENECMKSIFWKIHAGLILQFSCHINF